MRTFPLWVIGVDEPECLENGNLVFFSPESTYDELIEWDEQRRSWRLYVLDHYRWIPVEELEERSSDHLADPNIVNGTCDEQLPTYIP
jgi:hypothetical protein